MTLSITEYDEALKYYIYFLTLTDKMREGDEMRTRRRSQVKKIEEVMEK